MKELPGTKEECLHQFEKGFWSHMNKKKRPQGWYTTEQLYSLYIKSKQ